MKRVNRDLSRHRRGAVLGDDDRAAEVLEIASHLAHHQVAYGKADRRVNGVDGPGPHTELGGSGRSGHNLCPSDWGDGLPDAFERSKRTIVRIHSPLRV